MKLRSPIQTIEVPASLSSRHSILKRSKSQAEEQLAAVRKKQKQTLYENDKDRQAVRDKVARLKALRLAKETSESNENGS
jgi:hypothetical protein